MVCSILTTFFGGICCVVQMFFFFFFVVLLFFLWEEGEGISGHIAETRMLPDLGDLARSGSIRVERWVLFFVFLVKKYPSQSQRKNNPRNESETI